jgi:hypothetical protein
MQYTRHALSKVSVWVGSAGIIDTLASGLWVLKWSNDTHGAIRGLVLCMVGVAAVVSAGLVLLICAQTQQVITTNGVNAVLTEAALIEDMTAPSLRPHLHAVDSHGPATRRTAT